ncbi:STAS domain-containing protein [Glaciecola sp. 1036]|uniref:STAS domain-containing protein n=1 Tax=Alteromonadaceae TaxID=72275 RepID=UPI003D040DBF
MKIDISTDGANKTVHILENLTQQTLNVNFFEMAQGRDLKKQGVQHLDISLAKVDRADTAGLAWLLNLKRDAKANGIDVLLHDMPSKLVDLARLSGVETLLEAEHNNDK